MRLTLHVTDRASNVDTDLTDEVQAAALTMDGAGNNVALSITLTRTPDVMRLALSLRDNPFRVAAAGDGASIPMGTFLARSGEMRQPHGPLTLSFVREDEYMRERGMDPLLWALDNAASH